MFIPLRTDRPPRRRPLVTEGLIVVNLLVYLAGLIAQARAADSLAFESLVQWGAFDPKNFHWWQLFTSLFMHDPHSVWHLVFNMLFLWVFGAPVEDRLGRVGYLGFYLIGGAVAGLAHMMVDSHPVIGASGAIAAVTGAFLALFPRSHIIVLFWLFAFGVFAIPSLWFVGVYFLVDVLRAVGQMATDRAGNVAYSAHIAGYIYGFAMGFVLLGTKVIKRDEFDMFFLFTQARRRAAFRAASRNQAAGLWDSATADTARRLEKARKAQPPTAADLRLSEARAEVNRLAAANDLPGAAAKYRALLREAPDTVFNEQRQLELANEFCVVQDHAHAAAAYELLLDHYPTCSKAAEVRLILGVLYARQLNHPDRAREVIEAAKPALRNPRQTDLANELLAELGR